MKEFSPANTLLVVGGFPITGFMEGTFITVERETDTFSDHCGADGEVNRVRSSDKRATMTVTIKQTSASNDVLSGLQVADEMSGGGVVPVLMKDGDGRLLASGAEAWIVAPPSVAMADSTQGREWRIRIANLLMHVGGN